MQKPLIRQENITVNLICVCSRLHSDFIEYTPISREIKDAEEIASNDKVRFEDLVVTLVAVENGDNERVLMKQPKKFKNI